MWGMILLSKLLFKDMRFYYIFRRQIFWYLVPSLTVDKEHSNTCRVFSAWNKAKTILCTKAGHVATLVNSLDGIISFSSQNFNSVNERWDRFPQRIPSNYVFRVSKTSVAAGTFARHELYVVKKVSLQMLGSNYIDVINHRPLRATFAYYKYRDISSDSSGVILDYLISLAAVLLKSSLTNCCSS